MTEADSHLVRLAQLEARVHTLFDAIAHGDEAHRAWLQEAILDHFAGRPVKRERKPIQGSDIPGPLYMNVRDF